MNVIKICEYCGKVFNPPLKEHNRGNARFCSLSCSSSRKKPEPRHNHTCSLPECGRTFYRAPSRIKLSKSGLIFCNRICKEKAQRLGGLTEIQPAHYGTGSGETKYRKLAMRTYAKSCIDCGYMQHPTVLEVHHLDGDRKNSKLNNIIIICPTCHTERHYGLRPNKDYNGIDIPLAIGVGKLTIK